MQLNRAWKLWAALVNAPVGLEHLSNRKWKWTSECRVHQSTDAVPAEMFLNLDRFYLGWSYRSMFGPQWGHREGKFFRLDVRRIPGIEACILWKASTNIWKIIQLLCYTYAADDDLLGKCKYFSTHFSTYAFFYRVVRKQCHNWNHYTYVDMKK